MLPRILRHIPFILLDFPGRDSIIQIVRLFNHDMFKKVSSFSDNSGSSTNTMIGICKAKQKKLIAAIKSHCIDIYSPRKFTR